MAKDRDYQINGIVFQHTEDSSKKIRFLLLKRNPEKGSFWQPITGGAFSKEDKIKALEREVKEETQIQPKEIKNIIDTGYSFSFIDDDGDELHEYVYGVEVCPCQKIVLSKEHVKLKWVDIHEALSLLKYESNKKGLKILYGILTNQKG